MFLQLGSRSDPSKVTEQPSQGDMAASVMSSKFESQLSYRSVLHTLLHSHRVDSMARHATVSAEFMPWRLGKPFVNNLKPFTASIAAAYLDAV